MRTLILSTCGTSILTNQTDNDLRATLNRNANHVAALNIPQPERGIIERHLAARREVARALPPSQARRMSAELNGILSWYGGDTPRRGDMHILVSTDTLLGRAAAGIASDWLASNGANASTQTWRDLQTASLESFRVALADAVKWCDDTLPGYREQGWHVVFNLTGGFKAVNGFLQAVGMLYADETVYLFESSDELLRVPRLPIMLDAESAIRAAELPFRRLGNGLEVPGEIPVAETLLLRLGDRVILSEWGEVIWARGRRAFYREGLLEPLSPKVRVTDSFRASVRRLAADRIAVVNGRIDDLCVFAETGRNPRSLDVKALRAGPIGPSTHECDAWADQGAPRIFCHYEGSVICLDILGPGLH